MVTININNGVSLHSNHSCLVLWIYVWVHGVMDTIFPPLLISSISDFYIVKKSILNSKQFLPLPLVPEPLCSLISVPSLSWLIYLPPFSIFLQILCSFFVIVLFLLSWDHALPYLMSTLLENLTLYFCYSLLEWNDDSPVRQLWCTVYLYACNRRLKRAWSDEPKFTLIFLP